MRAYGEMSVWYQRYNLWGQNVGERLLIFQFGRIRRYINVDTLIVPLDLYAYSTII